jgi:hypothetical protein
MMQNTFHARVLGKALFGAATLACALAGGWGAGPAPASASAPLAAAELPRHWQGAAVRPLALSAVEERFAQRFPGRIARLTDGRQIVVLREVAAPTRMLHPAADCYRALGYRIEGEHLESTPPGVHAAQPSGPAAPPSAGGLQRCFVARQGSVALRVCEQIEDARGQRFADTSAWYWAATMGRSPGPWRAVTVTQPLPGGSV